MFKLPIEYVKTVETPQNMSTDLELVKAAEGPSLSECLYGAKTWHGKAVAEKATQMFTTNVPFLEDTVKWISKANFKAFDTEPFETVWQRHQATLEFKTLYQYVEHDRLEFLNHIPLLLFVLSIYSISSPVMFLLSPIFILIMPFAMLKVTGKDVDWGGYKAALMEVLKKHALGGLVVGLNNANGNQIVTSLLAVAMFGVQMYSNLQSCYQFYRSVRTVHDVLEKTASYLGWVTDAMRFTIKEAPPTYKPFVETVGGHLQVLEQVHAKLKKINPMTHSFKELKQIGALRVLFYELKHNAGWKESIEYSLAFTGYTEITAHLNKLLKTKRIAPCLFGKKKDKMVGAYYPPHKHNKAHTYSIQNYMITGPNASGKTTFIKTMMLNVLFSQQIGCGFYKKYYQSKPYEKLACYLNIPDTSGRDSLFQAEARRCKSILDETGSGARMLCIFDELFSGTNPIEASASAYAFLKHLAQTSNVTFLLTTHFLDVCKKLNAHVQNAHMETSKTSDGDLVYEYKFKLGISKIKGGLKVLKDLNFPSSILHCAQNFL